MRRMSNFGWAVGLAAVLTIGGVRGSAGVPEKKPSDQAKMIQSIGFKYLQRNQNEDGSYGREAALRPTVTALVIQALASSGRKYRETDGPFLSRAAAYLLSQRNADGSFGAGEWQKLTTALAATALAALDNPAYKETVAAAEAALPKLGAAEVKPQASLATVLALRPGAAAAPAAQGLNLTALLAEVEKPTSEGAADRLAAIIAQIAESQNRANDLAPEYGGFADASGEALTADPVAATALASWLAEAADKARKKLEKK